MRLVGPTGAELWATMIDGDMGDAFSWQDSTGETLASHVLAAVFDAERRVLDKLSLPEMSARQCELRGQLALDHLDPAAFAAALTCSSAAIAKKCGFRPGLCLGADVMGFDAVTAPDARSIPQWCAEAARAHRGEDAAARTALEPALVADPQDFIRAIWARNLCADHDSGNRYLDGLRLAGMPE